MFFRWNALKNPVNSTLIVLIFINLINYMDRSTIAGMMTDIRNDPYFNIETDKSLGRDTVSRLDSEEIIK